MGVLFCVEAGHRVWGWAGHQVGWPPADGADGADGGIVPEWGLATG